jgi:integrase
VIEEYMSVHAEVLSPATLVKFRGYARALAKFCQERPGFEAPLLSDGRDLPKPRVPKRKLPVALSRDEEARVVAAARPGRDRLIAQTLLATGLRISELCALTVDHVEELKARPPRLVVVGSVHNLALTKGRRDRVVGFRDTYRAVPRELLDWTVRGRVPSHARELFLADDGRPLTTSGVEQLMQRIGVAAGVRCNPHRQRHTWATRCADAGMPIFHLQLLGGWESVEMARRYYTASDLEAIASLDRFRC